MDLEAVSHNMTNIDRDVVLRMGKKLHLVLVIQSVAGLNLNLACPC